MLMKSIESLFIFHPILKDCFRSKSVVDNAQRAVAFAFWFIFSKKTLAVWGCLAPSYVFEHFQTHFFSILRVEFVPFSALIPFILVLHSSGFPILVRVVHPGQILWGDVGSGPNSRRSECEVQIIHLDQAIHQYPSWRLCLCRLKRIKWYLVIRVQMRLTTLCK